MAPERAGSSSGEVILGTLNDWPLGPRLASLLGLPEEAMPVACYQVIGNHGPIVSKHIAKKKETAPEALEPFAGAIMAAVETCSVNRERGFKSIFGFHWSASVAELREHLSRSFVVRTPAEARAARRPSLKVSLGRIEKALKTAPSAVTGKKKLMAYLESGRFSDSLFEVVASDLAYGIVAGPEALGLADARLAFLWATLATSPLSMPLQVMGPELGFDRLGSYVDLLERAGLSAGAARDLVLIDGAQWSRWWPSTGVWVWEQLRADPSAFIDHVYNRYWGVQRLADVLLSVLWLPEDALNEGALDLVRGICSSPALVPEATLKIIRANHEGFSVERKDEPERGAPQDRTTRSSGHLLASLTAADAQRALDALTASFSGAAQPAKAKPATKAGTTAKPAKAKPATKARTTAKPAKGKAARPAAKAKKR